MRKYKLVISLLAAAILLALVSLSTGCVQETLSRQEEPDYIAEEPDPRAEQERLELEQRQAEERQRLERIVREAQLKEDLGPFYVGLPPMGTKENPAVKAKGIYVTGHTVANSARFEELLTLVDNTELNAMVIDVKNDHGLMTYRSHIEIVQDMNANKGVVIKDIDAVIKQLRDKNIYPIARIVVFRDPHLPEMRPAWAIQKRGGGGQWRDSHRYAWVNPYEKNVWDYNIAIAKEAALKGFREIQFDYVRFPENAMRVDREAEFPGANGRAKDEAIEQFLAYAREQLAEYNVHLAADVFGVIATTRGDSDRIGQNWEKMSPLIEVICPMVYPSHYGPGYFGFAVPDANPAGTITRAMTDAIKRNAPLEKPATIRPWLQSFTATWVKGYIPYGPKEVRQQIDAALALGIDEFLIWNAGNRYSTASFLTEAAALARENDLLAAREEKNLDVLGNTQRVGLENYLKALVRKNWREAYLWQKRDFSQNEADYQTWVSSWVSVPSSYVLKSATAQADVTGQPVFTVEFVLASKSKKQPFIGNFLVIRENGIWKVQPPVEFLALLTVAEE